QGPAHDAHRRASCEGRPEVQLRLGSRRPSPDCRRSERGRVAKLPAQYERETQDGAGDGPGRGVGAAAIVEDGERLGEAWSARTPLARGPNRGTSEAPGLRRWEGSLEFVSHDDR